MRRILLSAALAGAFGLAASGSALADDTLLRVLAVQATDLPGYLKEVDALQALLKKTGQPVRIRVWQATYAGPDSGAVVVTIEMPDLAALAKLNDAEKTNPELAAALKKVRAMRKVVSDSLYDLASH
jgi:hypothetical protein